MRGFPLADAEPFLDEGDALLAAAGQRVGGRPRGKAWPPRGCRQTSPAGLRCRIGRAGPARFPPLGFLRVDVDRASGLDHVGRGVELPRRDGRRQHGMAAADRFLQRARSVPAMPSVPRSFVPLWLVKMLPRTPPIFMARSRDAASASATEEKTAVILVRHVCFVPAVGGLVCPGDGGLFGCRVAGGWQPVDRGGLPPNRDHLLDMLGIAGAAEAQFLAAAPGDFPRPALPPAPGRRRPCRPPPRAAPAALRRGKLPAVDRHPVDGHRLRTQIGLQALLFGRVGDPYPHPTGHYFPLAQAKMFLENRNVFCGVVFCRFRRRVFIVA